jgi:hypothetical protein
MKILNEKRPIIKGRSKKVKHEKRETSELKSSNMKRLKNKRLNTIGSN